MYSIDNNRLAKQISDLSNTNDRDHDEEFYKGELPQADFPDDDFSFKCCAHDCFLS